MPNSRDEYQSVLELDEFKNTADDEVFWVGLQEFDGETISVNGDEAVFTRYSEVCFFYI